MFIKYFKLFLKSSVFSIDFINFCLNLASVPVISTTSLTNTSTSKSNNNSNNNTTTSSSVVLTHQSASNSQTQQHQQSSNNNASPQVQVPILSLMAVPLGQQPGENNNQTSANSSSQ